MLRLGDGALVSAREAMTNGGTGCPRCWRTAGEKASWEQHRDPTKALTSGVQISTRTSLLFHIRRETKARRSERQWTADVLVVGAAFLCVCQRSVAFLNLNSSATWAVKRRSRSSPLTQSKHAGLVWLVVPVVVGAIPYHTTVPSHLASS